MTKLAKPSFQAISFAGGGNRCYWQGGFYQSLAAGLAKPPERVIGVSAGAYQAAIALAGVAAKARALVFDSCNENNATFDWSAMARGQTPFRVAGLYRDLLAELFGPAEIARLKQAPELLIQICHPVGIIPASVSVIGSILAYELEKKLNGARYSQAGRWLGLKPAWISTHDISQPAELIAALLATAAVPPFMPVGRVNGRPALDGGFVDNPPILKLQEVENTGGKTLVITPRSGSAMAEAAARIVARPSKPLTLSRFSVRDGAGMRAAYELGRRDGDAFIRALDTSR